MAFCPHCDHCKKLKRSQTKRSQPGNEIAFIQAEVDHLGDSIRTFSNERSLLLRRLNILRSSTRNLPPETLSLIFQFAVPPLDITSRSLRFYRKERYTDERGHHIPNILGAVCSRWHDVAHGTPQLWTSLIIDVTTRRDVGDKLALLQLYLTNVKNLSFSLELNLEKHRLPIDATYNTKFPAIRRGRLPYYNLEDFNLLTQFRDVIFHPQNARRVKVLRLSSIPSAWSPLDFTDWPRLEEIRLGQESTNCTQVRAFNAPRLNKLIIKHTTFTVSHAVLMGNNITIINLFSVSTSHCLELLTLCPNVTEFHARKTRKVQDLTELSSMWREEHIQRKMEVLKWVCTEDLCNESFLRYAQFPSLRVLAWEGIYSDHIESDDVAAFFGRLPPTLVGLELSEGADSDLEDHPIPPWEVLFEKTTSVQTLALHQYPLWEMESALGSLNPELSAGITYLPALREIRIVEIYDKNPELENDEDEEQEDGCRKIFRKVLWEMLEARRESFVDGLRLRVPRYFLWKRDKEWIRSLISQGLKLEILEEEPLLLDRV
ncbi:hypothetical protein P691DRAFT_760618 [Macrolepiota fuliginosa MF-IS2]|uniref:F-box domain-containing protein n=1 Tax=Macrolepiota fuliginosa MF-IS2 TaxID=1400762 RepID=A0A9P6C3M3_9AGAR|nr:hypothetical protein P691DRAFT_760618 [Macrolepiota fuliginosa MF-IS2]